MVQLYLLVVFGGEGGPAGGVGWWWTCGWREGGPAGGVGERVDLWVERQVVLGVCGGGRPVGGVWGEGGPVGGGWREGGPVGGVGERVAGVVLQVCAYLYRRCSGLCNVYLSNLN